LSRHRFPAPEYLDRILELSDDDDLDGEALIRLLKLIPDVWDELAAAMRIDKQRGPRRSDLCWLTVLIHYVAGTTISLEKFYKHAPDSMWKHAGAPRRNLHSLAKPHRPAKGLVYERLAELEPLVDQVWAAAGKIARLIRAKDPRFGLYWVMDGTPSESHVEFEIDLDQDMPAELRHRLENRLPLSDLPKEIRELLHRSSPRRVEGKAAVGKNSPWSLQRGLSDQPDVDLTEEPTSNVFEVDGEFIEVESHTRAKTGETYTRIRVTDKDGRPGLWRRCRDPEAWVRVYRRKGGQVKRIWIGYYHLSVVDVLTGATLFVSVFTARRNEYLQYPVAFEGAENVLGGRPLAVSADKGFDVQAIYEFNTRRGVGSAIPLRKDQATRNVVGQDRDEPRCKHCGGETVRVRFDDAKLRVIATCARPVTDECEAQQSFSSREDWRRRGPLSRLSQTFWELDRCRANREHSHKDRRSRYIVGGNDLSSRHKRIGTAVQALRAATASLNDMTAIAYRLGLVEEYRWQQAFETKRHKAKAAERLANWVAQRARMTLAVPYGPQAQRLGLGPAEAPAMSASEGRAGPT
jgi:hypothetical protein